MDKYRDAVRRAAKLMDGTPIYNASIDHAEVLVERLIGTAKKEVCILSGELHPFVYGTEQVLEKTRLLLTDPKINMRVLVENSSDAFRLGHPFFEAFLGNKKYNIEFGLVPDDVQDTYDFHLMVADAKSYRFEKNRNEPVAVAAFGDADGGKNLQRVFEIIWAKKEPLLN